MRENSRNNSFLRDALRTMRWLTIAALLILTTLAPAEGRLGLESWQLVLVFAGYNLAVDLLGMPRYPWLAVCDLAASTIIYFLGAQPDALLFDLFFLAVICASTAMSLRGSLFYTVVVAITVAAIHPTLPRWLPNEMGIKELAARILIMALVGAGTSALTRRLLLEEEELHAARRKAELEQLRSQFLSSLSHDLRTPITSTRAAVGMLSTSAHDRLQEDERALLASARRSIERLELLVDDLLTLSQLEAGVLQLEPKQLDLVSLAEEVTQAVEPLFDQKGQRLELNVPGSLVMVGDPKRLAQVLLNLLHNAHAHTPAGTIVRLSIRSNGDVEVCVSDNGPGIPTEELPKVFDRFYRGGSAGAAGLGLATCKALVELHGGKIWAGYSPSGGTQVCFHLPSAPRKEHTQHVAQDTHSGG